MEKRLNVNELILRILDTQRDNFLLGRDIICFLKNNNINLKPLALRHHIKQCRLSGAPIIADKRGYMLTTSKRDLESYIELRKIEIKSELKALKKMRKWF